MKQMNKISINTISNDLDKQIDFTSKEIEKLENMLEDKNHYKEQLLKMKENI